MQSAWIRSGGLFVMTTLFAAACTSADGSGGPPRDDIARTPLDLTDAGVDLADVIIINVAGASSSNNVSTVGVGGFGGGAASSSNVSTVGVGGFGGGAASSSVSSAVGVGGFGGGAASSSVSSASSASGVGGGAASSSSTGSGSGGAGGGATTSLDGSPCGGDAECASGYCVDKICCHTACIGACMACSGAKNGGLDGACGPVPSGVDPDNECFSPGTFCGAPGACDGSGACLPPALAGIPCDVGSCANGTVLDPPTCNGSGACLPAGSHPCPSTMCAGSVCKTSCATDGDCPSTEYCADPICAPKLFPGGACTSNAQCANTFCVDGFCCDSACNAGACSVCSMSKGADANGVCKTRTGAAPAGACDDGSLCTQDTCSAGLCDHLDKVCPAPGPCMQADACNPATGVCGEMKPLVCPATQLGVCETSVCDVNAKPNKACVTRSKLDGAPCTAESGAGLCVAGSCFTLGGVQGSGGAGGASTTSSAAGSGSATTGGGGGGGEGGGEDGKFHFVGGACGVGANEGEGAGRFAWLLGGLLLAARRRPRGARVTSRRWSRDG